MLSRVPAEGFGAPHKPMQTGGPRRSTRKLTEAMFYWGLGALIWLLLFVFLGIRTLRNGHWVMFLIGIILPLFWLIGALIPPTAETR
jgi:hypothetical protein